MSRSAGAARRYALSMQNPGIRVRDATSDDVDALTGLAAQVQTLHAQGRSDLFRPADPDALRDFLIARLADDFIVLIAEDHDGHALGYLLADVASRPESSFLLPHTSLYVHHIAVDADARRQRVGEPPRRGKPARRDPPCAPYTICSGAQPEKNVHSRHPESAAERQ